ncbi:MAG: DUF167 domain-containing protein [Rhodopirellula sp. JB053]
MIEIKETTDGCSFPVRVTPKAKKPSIGGKHDGALKVAVAAPPENGKANAAVEASIAKWLGTSKSSVEITAGLTSRVKTVLVQGVTKDRVATAIRDLG